MTSPSASPTLVLTPGGKNRRRLEQIAVQALLLVIVILFVAPFVWIAGSAFSLEALGAAPWPEAPTVANFRVLFDDYQIGTPLRNSVVVAVSATATAVITTSIAGYVVARVRRPSKRALIAAILMLQALPFGATMVPLFDLTRWLGLRNTYVGLAVVHAAIVLPFGVWLMTHVFESMPIELEEAAMLDGASSLRTWAQILLPNALPGIAVVAGYAFLFAWSEVILAVVLVDREEMRTIALAFFDLLQSGEEMPMISALAVVYVIPILAVFAVVGKLIARGIATSASGA